MPTAPERDPMLKKGHALQIAIFATGCSGIVAEYALSTLATYLIGNAVFQWTIVMSLMLFAMGLGSRFSRRFDTDLLDAFILVEFLLSAVVASSSSIAYLSLGFIREYTPLVVYGLCMKIGFLIGLEIPLVTRINAEYDELKVNISSVLEKDYYGALVGGLFFAFFALPKIGLGRTPIALGALNAVVALFLLALCPGLLKKKKAIFASCLSCLLLLGLLWPNADRVTVFAEQKQYRDQIIYSRQTPFQKIVMTKWKEHHWLFLNGQEQFSSYDEDRYHEPLVHVPMLAAGSRKNVLVLGGGDGLALREILKYGDLVEAVTLVDLDPDMTRLGATHPVLTALNKGSFEDPRVTVENRDAAAFLRESDRLFDVVLIDLPDPETMEIMHLYTEDFYRLVKRHLSRDGVMVTQATSPIFATDAFLTILATVKAAGLSATPYHTHIPTLGDWGWVMGTPVERPDLEGRIRSEWKRLSLSDRTRFLNTDTLAALFAFSKKIDLETLPEDVNSSLHPVLHKRYQSRDWEVN